MHFFRTIPMFLITLLWAFQVNALETEAFTQKRFEELQTTGEIILVDVYATWCPTCAKQRSALEGYRAANQDKSFYVLEVDFDKQKNVVRDFRAPRQSTLLLYKGTEQFWFSVAETRPEIITQELDKAFNFKAKK